MCSGRRWRNRAGERHDPSPASWRQPLRSVGASLRPASSHPRARGAEAVAARYAVSVTPAMAALIDPADPDDPIARQFVPDPAELVTLPQERADPIGDEGIRGRGRGASLPDRALLKLVHACPVYCRFCFRRERWSARRRCAHRREARGGAGLSRRPSRSGGHHDGRRSADPVGSAGAGGGAASWRDRSYQGRALAHRVPMVEPDRITAITPPRCGFPGKASYIAIHANHPREFTPAARPHWRGWRMPAMS